MKSWIFVWNPLHKSINEQLYNVENLKYEIEHAGFSYRKWCCGVNSSVKAGDNIYLLQLGADPKGIIAAGTAVSNSFYRKRPEDGLINEFFIKFDIIFAPGDENFITTEQLIGFAPDLWYSRNSGIEIPKDAETKINDILSIYSSDVYSKHPC